MATSYPLTLPIDNLSIKTKKSKDILAYTVTFSFPFTLFLSCFQKKEKKEKLMMVARNNHWERTNSFASNVIKIPKKVNSPTNK